MGGASVASDADGSAGGFRVQEAGGDSTRHTALAFVVDGVPSMSQELEKTNKRLDMLENGAASTPQQLHEKAKAGRQTESCAVSPHRRPDGMRPGPINNSEQTEKADSLQEPFALAIPASC